MSEWRARLRLEKFDGGRATFIVLANPEGDPIIGSLLDASFVVIEEGKSIDADDRDSVRRSKKNPAEVAEKLCIDDDFQIWASNVLYQNEGRSPIQPSEDSARLLITKECEIRQLIELDTDGRALQNFQTKIEIPYYRHLTAKKNGA